MKLFLVLTLVICAALASAQVALESLTTYKDGKVHFTQTVTYPAFTAENVFKTRFNAEIRVFTGAEVTPEVPLTFGGVAAFRFRDLVARGIDLSAGVFGKITQGEPASVGLYISISRHF